jgi:hypothetical protein
MYGGNPYASRGLKVLMSSFAVRRSRPSWRAGCWTSNLVPLLRCPPRELPKVVSFEGVAVNGLVEMVAKEWRRSGSGVPVVTVPGWWYGTDTIPEDGWSQKDWEVHQFEVDKLRRFCAVRYAFRDRYTSGEGGLVLVEGDMQDRISQFSDRLRGMSDDDGGQDRRRVSDFEVRKAAGEFMLPAAKVKLLAHAATDEAAVEAPPPQDDRMFFGGPVVTMCLHVPDRSEGLSRFQLKLVCSFLAAVALPPFSDAPPRSP